MELPDIRRKKSRTRTAHEVRECGPRESFVIVPTCWAGKPASDHLDHFRIRYQFLMAYNFRPIYNHKKVALQWQLLFVLKRYQNVAIQWIIPKLTNYFMRLVAIRLPISICTLVTKIFNTKTSFTRTKNKVWFTGHANCFDFRMKVDDKIDHRCG